MIGPWMYFKYQVSALAGRYSAGAFDYPEVAAAGIKEMHRQVGRLRVGPDGLARRGLIILNGIRSELVSLRQDVNDRFERMERQQTQTNDRLGQIEKGQSETNERLEQIVKRHTETEVRLATEIVEVAKAIGG